MVVNPDVGEGLDSGGTVTGWAQLGRGRAGPGAGPGVGAGVTCPGW